VGTRTAIMLAVGAVLGLGAGAPAATVAINATGSDSVGLTGALTQAYSAVSAVNSANFYGSSAALGATLKLTNAGGSTITFTRVDDYELFQTTGVTATFEAKWSGNNPETFGIANADGSNPYTLITGVGGPGSGVPSGSPTASITIPSNGIASPILTWFRDDAISSTRYYSNNDPHVVAFAITGTGVYANRNGSYLMAFNDPGGTDHDYNDLVVQISGVTPVSVPLPAAIFSGLAMLGGLGILRSARRRSRA
jgi:hypothetical protein